MREHITASTIYEIHKILRCAFNLAVRWEYIFIDKEEVAMLLNINISLPDKDIAVEPDTITEHEICVSDSLPIMSSPKSLIFRTFLLISYLKNKARSDEQSWYHVLNSQKWV